MSKAVVTDVMIDIETLDTRPSAVVLSIGAVGFNRRDPSVPMEYLDLRFGRSEFRKAQQDAGRTISADTVKWWKGQSPEAKQIFKQANVKSVVDALEQLTAFVKGLSVEPLVWGNGANFDNVIVASLYDSFFMEVPWKFWNDRCFRTMKGEHGHIARPPEFQGVKHDALADARQQAQYLQAIYAELQKYKIKSFKERQS